MKIIKNITTILSDFDNNNPFRIAAELNIELLYYPFSDNIKGTYIRNSNNNNHFIILNSSLNTTMERFVLAHEIGHSLLHPDINRYYIKKHTLLSTNKIEKEANLFAAELLIDDDQLHSLLENGESLPWIAFELNVPKELISLKIKNLG